MYELKYTNETNEPVTIGGVRSALFYDSQAEDTPAMLLPSSGVEYLEQKENCWILKNPPMRTREYRSHTFEPAEQLTNKFYLVQMTDDFTCRTLKYPIEFTTTFAVNEVNRTANITFEE